jgi:hypothetical protein
VLQYLSPPKQIALTVLLTWLALGPATPGRAADPASKPEHGWLDPLRYYHGLQQTMARTRPPEFVEYIQWNTSGTGMGWFHPGECRYDWKWLAARYDTNRDGKITRQEFQGPAELFDRLDRNQDGVLTAADFDWSVEQQGMDMRAMMARRRPDGASTSNREDMLNRLPLMMSSQLFNRIDTNGNGRISREEWQAVFTKAAKGKDYLTPEDLRAALPLTLPRQLLGRQQDLSGMWLMGLVRLSGMLKGETGSFFEGPVIGQRAPDFTLQTHDGQRTISLSDYRGDKPVVLIFGNFT